ncbi:MAG TPA: GTPase [Thermoanaerobaculia bacterium]|nr:GTPase [Thermoanaerobaculia bacterium]
MDDSVFGALAEVLERTLASLPGPSRERLGKEVFQLKELLMEARPPKLMILGRRGAGKSSLVNAIFGERVAAVGSVLSQTGQLTWYAYKSPKGELRILDTRGLGDRTQPESANFKRAGDQIKETVRGEAPDSILFLCKAKEVDAHIAEDVGNIVVIRRFIAQKHGFEPPVVALVTQVDELDPKRVEPPYADPVKQRNIELAVAAVDGALREQGVALAKVLPVSAYAEYGADGALAYSNSWNIDRLVEYLVDGLPQSAQIQMARLSRLRSVQERMARRLIGAAASLSAGIAAVPIPVADIVPLTALQVGLITGISYISGREMSAGAAREFLVALGANIGAAFVLREAARALAKVVFPVGGEAISAGVAFAGTWGVGEAAIAYFIHERSIAEVRKLLKRRGRQREV